jgi:succinyl-diaminopimelate desuccinylase
LEVLELARQLIARPSVTPDDGGCQELVAERLGSAGFEVERLPFGSVSNLWATHGDQGPLVCLAGHTDVVPPGPHAAWHSDPFEPEVRGGRLYGRGAADMKASVAAMTVALERLARRDLPIRVALLLTSDEEGAGTDGTRRVLQHLVDRGVAIDAAVVGEPTSERSLGDVVKHGRRGSMTGRVVVKGVQGHTAYPHLAVNAVHRLAPALAGLAKLAWPEAPPFPATSLQVSNIAAGSGASNVIPGECDLEFNIRFGTAQTAEEIQGRVDAVLRACGVDDPIAWAVSALPFLTEPGPLLLALEEAVREATGRVPQRTAGGGTSDARWFAAHGIPVAEFGPLNNSIHAANEWVEVDDLEPLARVYETVAAGLR